MGDIIKGLATILLKDYFTGLSENPKLYVFILALVLLPFIFQKDISGLAKFAPLGIVALIILFISTIILYFYKLRNNLILPIEAKMFTINSTNNPNIKYELFKYFGGFLHAFYCQSMLFPFYLQIKPRKTKSMIKSVIIGSTLSTVLYVAFGVFGFIIYRYDIQDSILKYFERDISIFKKENSFMFLVMTICFLAFLLNVSISTLIVFFNTKNNSIGFLKFIKQKLFKGETDKKETLIELEDKNDKVADIKNISSKKDENEEFPGEKMKLIIILICYGIVLLVALSSDKIITLDGFNGSTVSNYLAFIAPSMFYLYFSWGDGFNYIKPLSIFSLGLGVILIFGYFYFSFI